jgi:hypothetical protein
MSEYALILLGKIEEQCIPQLLIIAQPYCNTSPYHASLKDLHTSVQYSKQQFIKEGNGGFDRLVA